MDNSLSYPSNISQYYNVLYWKNKGNSEYGWVFDESKSTILYAQIRKFAYEHLDKEVDFDFYDDRQDILQLLEHVFKTYPHLIPKNVT